MSVPSRTSGANSPAGSAGMELNGDPGLVLRETVNDPALDPARRLEALESYVRIASGAVSGTGSHAANTYRGNSRPVASSGAGNNPANGESAISTLPRLPPPGDEVNNHIHTIYSFSPYTPSMAALRAREAGLSVAGSVDHDSYAAAHEMREACRILGLGAVTGFELRVSFAGTPFAARKLNSPDSAGIAYMTIQGVPAAAASRVDAFLTPIRQARLERTMAMTGSANTLLQAAGLPAIDFERDIVARSQFHQGGEVTERHLLAAVSRSIQSKGDPVAVLRKAFGMDLPAKTAEKLSDPRNPHLLYDVLGILKAGFLDRIFIQPQAPEIVNAGDAVAFGLSIDAVPAYAYLGDVAESPTGDKKAEKFEDDFLDELVPFLKNTGFRAITYMPPRNTVDQLARLQKLCRSYDFLEISGVDINSSRQSFNCPEVLQSEYRHLIGTTWALVAHERVSAGGRNGGALSPPAAGGFAPAGRSGLFADNGETDSHDMDGRVARLAALGRDLVNGDKTNSGAPGGAGGRT